MHVCVYMYVFTWIYTSVYLFIVGSADGHDTKLKPEQHRPAHRTAVHDSFKMMRRQQRRWENLKGLRLDALAVVATGIQREREAALIPRTHTYYPEKQLQENIAQTYTENVHTQKQQAHWKHVHGHIDTRKREHTHTHMQRIHAHIWNRPRNCHSRGCSEVIAPVRMTFWPATRTPRHLPLPCSPTSW